MNYEKIYFKFIDQWKRQHIEKDVYTEKHHIIPKHCGGGDEDTNLITLTYRQHVFAHRLLWKAYKRNEDLAAWKLMSSIQEDKKFVLCQMAGKIGGNKNKSSGHMSRVGKEHGPKIGRKHAESGFLDEIRKYANNETQRAKVKALGKRNAENGQLDAAREIALKNLRENGPSEKRMKALEKHNEKMKVCPKAKENCRKASVVSNANRKKKGEDRARHLLEVAERNPEYLNQVDNKSHYKYISPEGIEFGSPTIAARYYGNMKSSDVVNWCKKNIIGWRREKIEK